MSRLKLTSSRRQRLQRQLREASDVHLYRRTLAVLEFDRGRPVADIAQMLGVTRQSVSNWVDTYTHAHDPSALADADRAGRPRVWNAEEDDWLRSLLAASPRDLGLPNVGWTVPLIREAMDHGIGRRLSRRTIRRGSDAWATSGSGRATSSPPTPSARKKRCTRRQIAALPRRSAVLARDETDLLLFPPLRGLVAAGGAGEGLAQWPEHPAGHLRGDEPADRDAVVPAAGEGA